MRGRNKTNPPATISIIPTAIMNACAENGNRLSKAGERYASQLVRKLVNLSRPATIGTRP